jgi:hypothetical protein
VLPQNETAFRNMRDGWSKVVRNVDAIAAAGNTESAQ